MSQQRTAENRRRHVLDLDDFTAEEIKEIFVQTDAMVEILQRSIKQVPTLRGFTVVNAFYEDSTRTRISFEVAAKTLSASVVNFSAKSSSVQKGESLVDTVRTLEALGADLIVLRHNMAGAPYLVAQHFSGSVINAGDGKHAHPTQGLLDLYTMQRHLGQIRGKHVLIVGDILHSRVARSNLWGLSKLGAKITLCGPPTLLGRPSYWEALFPKLRVSYDLDLAVEKADVIMLLRLQRERMEQGLLPSLREYIRRFSLTPERLSRAPSHALVMHPGPMNEGLEIAPEVARSSQSVIEEQVTNGVAVRMALLYMLGGR
ncbi:MAG: aspartate carbamoyltransferase catalytic subunit [Chloroflexia bacterium]|nr:aspartate carbamoyltransferase catalytic subunit [Chloroflexia bacterium]